MRIHQLLLSAAVTAVVARTLPNVQTRDERDRAQAVKDAFTFAWNGFSSTCKNGVHFHDELHPVSGTCGDSRNGWGASAIDALGTAAIMGMTGVVDDILTHIQSTDFTNAPVSDDNISVFESTIRYLGGMLSAYDLLNVDGPRYGTASNMDQVRFLQNQSLTIAQSLRIGYQTPLSIADNGLDLEHRKNFGSAYNSIATAALQLEFVRLADMWNDPTYKNQAEAVQPYLSNPSNVAATPFGAGSGMIGDQVTIASGAVYGPDNVYTLSWGPGSDSYYEYLLKYWIYDPSKTEYLNTWKAAADTTIEHLGLSPNVNKSLLFVSDSKNQVIQYDSGHLNSFAGGNFILAGMTLNETKYLDFGLRLADSCAALYSGTATGIGPEGFGWSNDGSNIPSNQVDFYNQHGYWINTASYDLRPEVLETWYYAYRATGDEKYRDYVWDAFNAIQKYCKVGNGFSSINNVMSTDTTSSNYYGDLQESFVFAEVFKYAYMIFIDEADWQVAKPGQETKFVFNTEAHPLKIKALSHSGYNPA